MGCLTLSFDALGVQMNEPLAGGVEAVDRSLAAERGDEFRAGLVVSHFGLNLFQVTQVRMWCEFADVKCFKPTMTDRLMESFERGGGDRPKLCGRQCLGIVQQSCRQLARHL